MANYEGLKDYLTKSLKSRKKKQKKKEDIPKHYKNPDVDVPKMDLEPLPERAERYAKEAKEVKKVAPKPVEKKKDSKPKPKKKKKKKASMSDYLSHDLDIPMD